MHVVVHFYSFGEPQLDESWRTRGIYAVLLITRQKPAGSATSRQQASSSRPTTRRVRTSEDRLTLLIRLQDFFYICPGHLVDRGFCQPDADEAAAVEAKKKKDELDAEIEKVKKEYEEKQRLKREKRKGKEKDKDKAKEKESQTQDEEEDKQDEKAKEDKVCSQSNMRLNAAHILQIKELSKSKEKSQSDLAPRVYHLNK